MTQNIPLSCDKINDKYLLASILQKSIRLGLTQSAKEAATALFQIDKNYLMYRMMIIAFEDVGLGNLELMKDITSYRWGVRKFKERNIDFLTYFQDLSEKLCSSLKDRTACDATYLLSLAYGAKDIDNVCQQIPALSEIWKTWSTLGFKRYAINEHKLDTEDNVEAYIKEVNLITSKDNAYLNDFYSTQVDPFFLSVPILDKYLLPENTIKSESMADYSLNFLTDGATFPLSAVDGHTRLGANCIKTFLNKHQKEIYSFFSQSNLISSEDIYLMTKKCLFRVEGQNVNPKLIYPVALEIKDLVQKKECEYFFHQVKWGEYITLGKFLKNHLNEINDLRIAGLRKEFLIEPSRINLHK